MARIVVIEDERTLREALAYNVRREGFTVIEAGDAIAGVQSVRQEEPDLVLLDLMLPGGSGLDVCRAIRSSSTVPIIILTARHDDADRVLGLEIGADDYVTKPFSMRELLARIRANLRRVDMDRGADRDATLRVGPLEVDLPGRRVSFGGRTVALQPKEFDLLVYFMRHPGAVLSRARLLADVWGHEFVGERTVDVHVRRIRAKLGFEGDTDPITTVHRVGYLFSSDVLARPTEESRT